MNYIVTKPTKSRGIAVILVFLFWPIGLFYSTVLGGVIMSFVIGPLVVLNMDSSAFLLILIVYFMFCLIWTVLAVDAYNRKLISESFLGKNNYDSQTHILNQRENVEDQKLKDLYQDLDRLETLRATNVVSVEKYNQQKNNILNSIKLLETGATIENINFYHTPPGTNTYPVNQYEKKRGLNLWIWILFLLFIVSVLYFLYYQGIFSNNSGAEKKVNNAKSESPLVINKEFNRSVESRDKKVDNKLDRNIFKNSDNMGWKVTEYFNGATINDGKTMNIETDSKYFIFYEKKIYLLVNGNLIKTWHETKGYFEGEIEVTETKEGDTFSVFGDIDILYKSGKSIHYEIIHVPIIEVPINSKYLK